MGVSIIKTGRYADPFQIFEFFDFIELPGDISFVLDFNFYLPGHPEGNRFRRTGQWSSDLEK